MGDGCCRGRRLNCAGPLSPSNAPLPGSAPLGLQAIFDLIAPSLVHDNGRLVLVGDSGCVLRPHTAAGEHRGLWA